MRPQALAKRVMRGTEDRHDFTQLSEWRPWKWPLLSSGPSIVPARQGRGERLILDLHPSVLC